MPRRLFHEQASASGSLIDRSLDVNRVTIFSMVIVSEASMIDRQLVSDEAGLFNALRDGVDVASLSHDSEFWPLLRCMQPTGWYERSGRWSTVDGASLHVDKMIFVELAVSGHAGIGDPPVDARADREGTRPILGAQRRFEPSNMRFGHAHEPALLDTASHAPGCLASQ